MDSQEDIILMMHVDNGRQVESLHAFINTLCLLKIDSELYGVSSDDSFRVSIVRDREHKLS